MKGRKEGKRKVRRKKEQFVFARRSAREIRFFFFFFFLAFFCLILLLLYSSFFLSFFFSVISFFFFFFFASSSSSSSASSSSFVFFIIFSLLPLALFCAAVSLRSLTSYSIPPSLAYTRCTHWQYGIPLHQPASSIRCSPHSKQAVALLLLSMLQARPPLSKFQARRFAPFFLLRSPQWRRRRRRRRP